MLQFYVTVFLSAKGAQQDIKPFYRFSLHIFKMAKTHKQPKKLQLPCVEAFRAGDT